MSVTELLSDPGFETFTGTADDDTTDSWTSWTPIEGAGIVDATETANGGSYAVKITAGSATNSRIGQLITVTPLSEYRLSFYTRGDGTYSGRYKIHDGSHSTDIVAITDTNITGTTYTWYSKKFKAPAGCTGVNILFYCPDINTGVAYFDDASVKKSEWTDDCFNTNDTAEDNLNEVEENFQLLKDCFAGENAPNNPESGQFWLDTSSSTYVMKQRNKDNDSWLTLWNLTTADVPKGKIETHEADDITSSNTVHGIQLGSGNGLDADTVDGYEASELLAVAYVSADGYYARTGTDAYVNASADADFTDASYTKQKEIAIRVCPDSTLRLVFDLKTEDAGETVYGKIYRNGVAVGTERSHTGNTDWDTQSTEDIAGWSDGDLLQLYCYTTNGATGHCRSFKILYQKTIEVTMD